MKRIAIVVTIHVLVINLSATLNGTCMDGAEGKLKRELDAKLPAESRHSFLPLDKKWIKTIRYRDPIGLERFEAEKVPEELKKRFEKEEVFSLTGKAEGDYRLLTYEPDGKLRGTMDKRGDDEFDQSVYADGSIRHYRHQRKGKMREAYTVSPDGKQVHRVVSGDGFLKYHGDPNDHNYNTVAYYQGDLFFVGAFTGKKLTFIGLHTNSDKLLRWREGSEEFIIDNQRTAWSRDSKGDPKLRKLDGEYDLNKLDPERVKLWQGKYAECLDSFFDRYDALLKKAGYTWEKLGIEFVRKKAPFPDE